MDIEKETVTDELEKEGEQFFAIKCKLKNALIQNVMEILIKNRVDSCNKILIESYFLFNQYILTGLSKNKSITFDETLINRCTLYVLGKKDQIRNNKTLDEINKL